MKMLIDFGLIPDKYDLQRRVYNFNKYLKKNKFGTYYALDNIAFGFYEKHFDMDNLIPSEETESGFVIKQTTWDKIYQSHMDKIRPWVRENAAILLEQVNERLTRDTWNKYCQGNLSKWEMDAVSFYSHEHELETLILKLMRLLISMIFPKILLWKESFPLRDVRFLFSSCTVLRVLFWTRTRIRRL